MSMGGWRWTCPSPTGSGPEGSSPNELDAGYCPTSYFSGIFLLVNVPLLANYNNYYMACTAEFVALEILKMTEHQKSKKTAKTQKSDKPNQSETPKKSLEVMSASNGDKASNASQFAASEGKYTVLARKYRPLVFDDLIGQDALVRTVRNAFSTGRIAQAYMLTGVRGVGKTTTARILARALNYQTEEIDSPTVDMAELGEHCTAIIESRHVDVLEMDAASHTGVDNIREIIESARYKPASARYKVYIIDEVHMLSKGAFNALLKTLEEPPDHVKFIFATTEVQKVPVTVLSRCQRFDLRRVDVDQLVRQFNKISTLENVQVEKEALHLIARAAEGSVRDGLSILDQTIALGAGVVTSEDIRSILGLSDQMRIFDLLAVVFSGDTAAALKQFDQLYADGAEPGQILTNLAEAVHLITRTKAADFKNDDQALSEAERKISVELSKRLSMSSLGRAWQMLLKGINEVEMAPNPIAAAEMVLIRMTHLTHLPSPEDVVRSLGLNKSAEVDKRSNGNLSRPTEQRSETGNPVRSFDSEPQSGTVGGAAKVVLSERPEEMELQDKFIPQSFDDIVAYVAEKRDLKLKLNLEEFVQLVRFKPGHVEVNLAAGSPDGLPNELGQKLSHWTGERWIVSVTTEPGSETIAARRRAEDAAELENVKQHPLVREVLQQFPEAEITDIVKTREEETNRPGTDKN